MSQVIRCLHEKDYVAIRDGNCTKGFVRVYYGFNNYNDSPAHVKALTHIALTETYTEEEDMHVHRVTREESIRHADHTMIQFTDQAAKIKDNLNNYTIL